MKIPVTIISLEHNPAHVVTEQRTSTVIVNGESKTISASIPVTKPESFYGNFNSKQFGRIHKSLSKEMYEEFLPVYIESTKGKEDGYVYIYHRIRHEKGKKPVVEDPNNIW